MTKADLIDAMAADAGISKAAATKALGFFMTAVAKELKKNGKLSLVGFGTFSVSSRKARKGRNPQTGEAIKIPAKKIPKFSAGATLKAMVNGKKAAAKGAKAAKPVKAAKAAGAAKAVKAAKTTKAPAKPAKAGRAKKK